MGCAEVEGALDEAGGVGVTIAALDEIPGVAVDWIG